MTEKAAPKSCGELQHLLPESPTLRRRASRDLNCRFLFAWKRLLLLGILFCEKRKQNLVIHSNADFSSHVFPFFRESRFDPSWLERGSFLGVIMWFYGGNRNSTATFQGNVTFPLRSTTSSQCYAVCVRCWHNCEPPSHMQKHEYRPEQEASTACSLRCQKRHCKYTEVLRKYQQYGVFEPPFLTWL